MLAHINEYKQRQTVERHLESTAEICRELGKTVGLENMMFLTGLLHDIGKNTKKFNQYLLDMTENINSHKKGEVDHSTAGGQYVFNMNPGKSEIYRVTGELMAYAIFSHHGLIDMVDESGKEVFILRTEKSDIGYEEALENSRELLNRFDTADIFNKAADEIKAVIAIINDTAKKCNGNRDTAFFMLGCLQRLVCSILIDGDRTDTAEFMSDVSLRKIIDYDSLWKSYENKLNEHLAKFKGTDKISLLRGQMSKECYDFAAKEGGIYCLPIPTGGGKTLASLRYALEHCKKYNKKRIIYVAPYLSILEQNASEIKAILKDEENILEHHSNIVFEDDKQTAGHYKYLTDLWTSPVILTSMVRLLEVMFSGDTTNVRRFNRLANSVVIFDEIQSLPVRIINLFNQTANFLSKVCNATIILCSATQPLLGEAGERILYGSPVNMISDVNYVSDAFRRVRIIDKTRPEKYTTEELADFVLEKADDNMLVILNTKGAVRELCRELESRKTDYEIYQLTTYMCPQHRNQIIREIKDRIGNTRLICVSTQLIEAGVDISFNNVIRSLAGLDSVIQAAGRCNRHGNADLRFVYIINYAKEKVESLEDISRGQDCMGELLFEYKKKYDEYGMDYLLSNEAIENYYQKYFYKRKQDMYYNVDGAEIKNLFQALSVHPMHKNHKRQWGTVMSQAYRFAGKSFAAIDSNTIGVIVPYKEGAEKLKKLLDSKDFREQRQLLKELQRYTVNVYGSDKVLSDLKSRRAVTAIFDESIYVLSEGFYDNEKGLSSELNDYIF